MDLSGSKQDNYRFIEKSENFIQDLLEKNRKESNLFILKSMWILVVVNILYLLMYVFVYDGSSPFEIWSLGINIVILILTPLICKGFVDKGWMRYVLLGIVILSACLAKSSISIVTIMYFALPVALSCRYYDEKFTISIGSVAILCGIAMIIFSSTIDLKYGYIDTSLIRLHQTEILYLNDNFGQSIINADWFNKKNYILNYIVFYLFEFITLIIPVMVACYESAKSGKLLLIEEASIRMEKNDAVRDLQESKMEIMISQIQPHFLYNALNSIYYLVDKDGKKAKQAIADFSDYLRANLNFSKTGGLVPFSQEMEHINKYLALEKLRFEDDLNIIIKCDCNCFRVPSLAIQPLVENAVKHGISKKINGGTLSIISSEEENAYVVKIIDNGVGFDQTKPLNDNRKHIGLENSKYRLETMCNAKINIESELGKGTTVTIEIPKEYYYEDTSR